MDERGTEKQRVRAAVRAQRSERPPEERSAAGAALSARLQELVQRSGAHSLTCYLPVRGEPDTGPFLDWARQQELEVLLPSSQEEGRLEWLRHRGGSTVPGMFGIPEPAGDPAGPEALTGVDLMLIPACAVDERGMRLGWGRGYFDRALGALPEQDRPAVYAVVFDEELLPNVPADPHDVPVDGAVTPRRVIDFG